MFHNLDPVICVPATIIFIVLFISLISYIYQYKKRKVFKQIAMKKDGRVKGIVTPKLNFLHKGCKVKVVGNPEKRGSNSSGSYYTPPKTKVIVKLRKNVNLKMIIKKKHLGHKIAMKLGVKYIETGDLSFNNHCVAKGDKEFALEILNKKVINHLSTGYPTIVKLKGKRLLLEKRGYSENEMFFTFQINKATAIIDRLVELGYI